jgi:hypothetical protein
MLGFLASIAVGLAITALDLSRTVLLIVPPAVWVLVIVWGAVSKLNKRA